MNKNNRKSPYYAKNNKAIMTAIGQDYEKSITFNGNNHVYMNTPLLSVSSIIDRFMSIKMGNIPPQKLDELKNEGSMVMDYLKMIFTKKIKRIDKIDWFSEKIKNMVYAILQLIIDNQWKLVDVETHICNRKWHGYVDMTVRDEYGNCMLVEIKTRGNLDIRTSDKLQIMTYAKIVGCKLCGVLIVNRKTFECRFEKVGLRENVGIMNKLNNWLELMDLNGYAF